ncbi:MAG: hypothetical protein JW816_00615 [Candidatus Buchananbacteria bacterium]|nr:hypothetical protein [Candidatus Buchananbacteria bacterium]
MKKSIVYFFTALVIIAIVGLGLFLFNKNIPASGYLKVNAELGKDTPIISALKPAAAVRLVDGSQELFADQVYFDLRSLKWFKGAWIEIVYQSDGRLLNGLGAQIDLAPDYNIKKPLSDVELADGWQQALFYFDFENLVVEKNVKHFVIDTVGQPDQFLKIKSINIILER